MNYNYSLRYLTGTVLYRNGVLVSDSRTLAYGPPIVKSGTKNRDWLTKIQRGEFVGSSYRRSFFESPQPSVVKASSSYQKYESWDWRTKVVDVTYHVPIYDSSQSVSQQTMDQALLNYYSRLRMTLTKWESLATAAELRSTVDGLMSRYDAMRTYVRSASRRALSRTGRVAKGAGSRQLKRESISGIWLEFHLGLSPLIMDFEDAAVSFCDPDSSYLISVVGKSARKRGLPTVREMRSANNWDRIYFYRETKVDEKARFQGFFNASILNQYSRQGIDSTGAVMALWEVVPLSFVIDYFAQVDKLLLSALQVGISPSAAVITTSVKTTSTITGGYAEVHEPSVPGDVRGATVSLETAAGETTYGIVTRSVDTSGRSFGLPSSAVFRRWNELHWSQQLTCTALATQASKRLRKLTWFL